MANPIVSEFALVKKLLAWAERAQKQGIDLSADLQPSIDDPSQMERLVHYIRMGAPVLQVATPLLSFDEPESHRMAREILGKDFLGVPAAQRHFGPYAEAQLAARQEIPFLEKTLRECAGKFVLVATHEFDLPTIHSVHPARFNDDPDDPWFGRKDQREKWSAEKITVPWLLVRKAVLPDSTSKNIDVQKKHIEKFPQERFVHPCEFAYSALLSFLETRQKLCEGYVVRFPLQAAGRYWVSVGWGGDQLRFFDWSGDADDRIGSGSVRTS